MFMTFDNGFLRSASVARLAGLVACALLASACHGGVDTIAGPSAPDAASLSAPGGDEASSGDAVASARAAAAAYEMAEKNLSGHSGTCSLAAARLGFRLKAQGHGTPGTRIAFHLIMPDGFRTTEHVDVSRQGTFRTGQDLVTSFPPGISVRCVLLSLDGALLAESTTFQAP